MAKYTIRSGSSDCGTGRTFCCVRNCCRNGCMQGSGLLSYCRCKELSRSSNKPKATPLPKLKVIKGFCEVFVLVVAELLATTSRVY